MATVRQKLAFNKIIENQGNVSKSMREVGYAFNTAKVPSKNLTETKGFQELCNEHGLTDDFLVKALIEDIGGKPKNRKAELELAFKIKGRMIEDKPENTRPINLVIPIQVSQSFNIDGTHNETERGNPQQEQI